MAAFVSLLLALVLSLTAFALTRHRDPLVQKATMDIAPALPSIEGVSVGTLPPKYRAPEPIWVGVPRPSKPFAVAPARQAVETRQSERADRRGRAWNSTLAWKASRIERGEPVPSRRDCREFARQLAAAGMVG